MTEQDSFQCSQTLMRTRLKRMLNPQSAVFIGGSALVPAIDYCRTNRFKGNIYVVNPFKAELAGIPCHASLADLPDVPDMAFIGVAKEVVVETVTGSFYCCGR